MPTMTTPQELAAAIEEALDLGGHLLIRFAHAQVRQLKNSEVELLVDTLKAAQPEERRTGCAQYETCPHGYSTRSACGACGQPNAALNDEGRKE